MRVLITGAGGFVGHHLYEHLLVNTDWELVLLDSFRHRGKTDRIREVMKGHRGASQRTHVFPHDLTVPISPQLAAAMGDVGVIFNLASESHVDRSIEEPRPFVENNVALILTMLDYARQLDGLRSFIQVSTDEVYGPAPAGHAHVEWETHLPSNPYSASKSAQESIAFSYWRTYDLPLILTNTMNIIGERQDPEKFVPMVIRSVLAKKPVTIHGSAEAIGSRFYLHARNQADALLFLSQFTDVALRSEGYDRPDRYHVVGEREVDNLEMAKMIAEFAGHDLAYEFVDFHSTRPGHDLRYALDGTKLGELGWVPPVPLEKSLERTVHWSMEHHAWLL